jgi:hypothetical protein
MQGKLARWYEDHAVGKHADALVSWCQPEKHTQSAISA